MLCAVFIAVIWVASSLPIAVCAMEGGCPDASRIQAGIASLLIVVPLALALAFARNGQRRQVVAFARAALVIGALLALYFLATSQIASGVVQFLVP